MTSNNSSQNQDQAKTIWELLGFDNDFFNAPASIDLPVSEPPETPETTEETKVVEKKSKKIADLIRYPLVFAVALGFFYLLLNFRAVSSQIGAVFSPPPENEQAVLGDDLPEFNNWIKKYYAHVNNQEILAANNDADADGLTNHEEFYLKTNPFKKDTDRDGFDDGREVLNGYNPSYEGKLTESQKKIISTKLNLDHIASRRSWGGIQRVAGAAVELPVDDFQVDASRPGRIEIPKLGVAAPIIWNKDFAEVQEDLKYGVVHHPATKFPGERGLSSLHGHSSGYPWDGNYKTIFTQINFLEPGDEIFVKVYGTNGENRRYRYVVRSKGVYSKTDEGQFQSAGRYFLNLSTSWPIGTARERFVVTAELAGL